MHRGPRASSGARSAAVASPSCGKKEETEVGLRDRGAGSVAKGTEREDEGPSSGVRPPRDRPHPGKKPSKTVTPPMKRPGPDSGERHRRYRVDVGACPSSRTRRTRQRSTSCGGNREAPQVVGVPPQAEHSYWQLIGSRQVGPRRWREAQEAKPVVKPISEWPRRPC